MSGVATAATSTAALLLLMGCDADGVLTDGTPYFSSRGDEIKAFSSLDGHGLKMLQRAGGGVAIISCRGSQALELRARNLEARELHIGVEDKRAPLKRLAAKRGFGLSQTGYMGDDEVNLPVLRACGFSATVADGRAEVRPRVGYVASQGGGAVRGVCDLVLRARGKWDDAMAEYLA